MASPVEGECCTVLIMRLSAFIVLAVLLSNIPLFSQQKISSYLIRPAPADTDVVAIDAGAVAFAPPEEKSTSLAMLLSAAVPGTGQLYTGRYLSIPIFYGFGYYFWKQYDRQNNRYQDFSGQYAASVIADTAKHTGNLGLRDTRDFYRDDRDRFAIYMGLTYILNIVDAYVGAALYGFDVSPNLSPKGNAEIRLRYTVGRMP